jgi:hypothetical protein
MDMPMHKKDTLAAAELQNAFNVGGMGERRNAWSEPMCYPLSLLRQM